MIKWKNVKSKQCWDNVSGGLNSRCHLLISISSEPSKKMQSSGSSHYESVSISSATLLFNTANSVKKQLVKKCYYLDCFYIKIDAGQWAKKPKESIWE